MNDSCLKAQELIYNFEFDEAQKILNFQAKTQTNNIAINWLNKQIIFLKIFSSEDKILYSNSLKNWNLIIQQVENQKFNNAWYRFVLSEMYFHKAMVKLRFNEIYSAATDIRTANNLLKENLKMFPAFLPDNKTFGTLQCLFSTIPSKYSFFSQMIGFEGKMQSGLEQLEILVNSDLYYGEYKWIRKEAAFMLSIIQHHFNKNSSKAWEITLKHTNSYQHNVFENYFRATVANYVGKNDDVISILNYTNHQKKYFFHQNSYMMGLAKLRKLDKDADLYFQRYILNYKGQNLIKSSYRFLAWSQIIKNQTSKANEYYLLCSSKGNLNMEEDKQADIESRENKRWHAELLKSRLLFDGKYFDKALKTLDSISIQELKEPKFKFEWSYRKARILHEKKQKEQAINQYKNTIEQSKNSSFYYAAYSCLYIAQLFEEEKNYSSARVYYQKAKNDFPNNKEYVNTIEHKAKAGLKRLENK